jgi:hypothetical protein
MFPPLFMSTLSRYSKVDDAGKTSTAVSDSTWVANLAYLVPIRIPWPYPIKRFFVYNGATPAGNCDMGLYARNGARLISTGSFAISGGSHMQYQAASYLASPGSYWLALAYDSSSASVKFYGLSGGGGASFCRHLGIPVVNTGFPLPVNVSPVGSTYSLYPIYGFTLTESGW